MPEYDFPRETLRRGLNIAKTIKPSVGDVSFSFTDRGLTLFSFDNRRYVRVEVVPGSTSEVDTGYESDEFYIFLDKTAIFDTELDNIIIDVNESSLDVKAIGGGQTRRSSLKKRSTKSRRPDVPSFPRVEFVECPKSSLDELLRCVSCSASVRDGKTEDDMRTMQIHFYDNGFATSSTRYHASLVTSEGINYNASIISADIPLIRSFFSKIDNDQVGFGQDKDKIYFADLKSRSFLCLSKIATERPTFQRISDDFSTSIVVDQELLMRNLRWSALVVERTQRISLIASKNSDDDSGTLVISFQKQSADGIPIKFLRGDELRVDLPVDKLMHIVSFLEKTVVFKFGHSKSPPILELSSGSDDSTVQSWHYIASMKANEA
jgi:hypothetical protein